MDDRQDLIDSPSDENRESTRDDATPQGDHATIETKVSPEGTAAEGDDAPGKSAEKRSPWGFIVLGVVILAGLSGGGWYWYSTRNLESTDDAFVDGRAITITPQVQGVVTDLAVADNQFMHAGDVLLRIDPRDYVAARDLARGQLSLAQAQRQAAVVNLDLVRITAPQKLLQARAQSTSAVAAQFVAASDDRRQHALTPLVVSKQDVEKSTATDTQAGAATAQAAAAEVQAALVPQLIAQAVAPVAEADAQITQARANLDQAELNLSYTIMRAPQDGWITKRNVERGDYLQVGASVFSIVTPEVWITANFKETQLNRMRPGQRVEIAVDAYPSLRLSGHVDSVQRGSGSRFTAFPAENATGNYIKIVQRIPVKIVIDSGLDPKVPLPLGLSVDPTVTLEVSGTKQAAEDANWKPAVNPWAIALVVTLVAFMEILDTTIVNVALPHISGTMSVSNDEATWTLTAYLVANGIVLPISGWLGNTIGRKRYFLICIAMFTLFSLFCGLSESLPQLVVCRLLQGFFGGGLQPNQQSIILDTFAPAKRAQAFAVTAVATIVAPVLGPTLGGWITDNYSWRWIFFINIPIGIMTFFGVFQLVQDPPWQKRLEGQKRRVDFIGISLIALGFGSLQVVMDRGEDLDWFGSNFIIGCAMVAAIGLSGAVVWLSSVKNPVVSMRVFANRNFAVGCVMIFAMAMVLYSSAVNIPELAQTVLGYTATWAGLILSPGAILVCFTIPIVGKIMPYIQTRFVIAIGFLLLGWSLVYSHGLTPDIDFKTLVLMRSAQSFGLAFLFVPISTIAYSTLPKELNGDAAALFTMFRNLAGSIGISAATAFVTERTQARTAHLVDNLNPFNQQYNQLVAQQAHTMLSQGFSPGEVHQRAVGLIYRTLQTQASVLAYMDVFAMCAILAFCAVPLTLLFKTAKNGGAPAAH